MAAIRTLSAYPTRSLFHTLLFCLLVLVWWLEAGLRVPALAAIRFEFLLAGTASAIAVMGMTTGRKARQPGSRNVETNSDITGWIIAIVVVAALGLPFSLDLQISWNVFLNRFAKFALLGSLIAYFVVSPLTLRYHLLALLLAFMKIGQEAFLGKITGSMVWENQGVPRLNGAAGTMFGSPNSLSGKTVSILPFIWFIYPTIQRNWTKILLAVQLIFAFNIIIFTASRTGYMTLIAAAIFAAMLSQQRKGKLLTLLVFAGIVSYMLLPQEYQDRFMSSFTGQEAEGKSSDTRKGLFFDSVKTFADNPLGVGIGCFSTYQAINGRNAQETHNLYTQILAEAGIQTFVCFLGLVTAILRKAFRCRRVMREVVEKLRKQLKSHPSLTAIEREIQDGRLLLATTNAVIVFVLVRLVLGIFGHDFFEIYWWVAAGLVMSLHNMRVIAERRCAEIIAMTAAGVPIPIEAEAAKKLPASSNHVQRTH